MRHSAALLVSLLLLAAGVACDRSRSEPTCADECEAGATRCAGSEAVQPCVHADGCLTWGAPEPCAAAQACVSGACACLDPCVTGQVLCASATEERRCADPDEQGCTTWGPPEPCADGVACENGSCGCADPCVPGTTACTPEGELVSCAGDGPCPSWGAPVACGERRACVGQTCVCDDECAAGESACVDELTAIACGEADADGCRAWAVAEACPPDERCVTGIGPGGVGLCLPPSPPECDGLEDCDFEGQIVCMDATRYRLCLRNADGCLHLDCFT